MGQQLLRNLLLAIPAAAVAYAVLDRETRLTQVGGLFTAASILTGLTFSMATTFWSRSIDARDKPGQATDAALLSSLDASRDHLIWTVAVGIAATAELALMAIFSASPNGLQPGWTALSAFLIIYLVTLVGWALRNFQKSAKLLQ